MSLDPKLAEVLVFRPMEAGDVPFVLDSWLRAYRESPWAGVISNHRYFDVMHEVVEDLLARGAKVEVAASRADPTRILGWACTERLPGAAVAHFVYVKDPFRRRGLASHLLERSHGQEDRHFYTFRTRGAAYFPGWQFEPAIARRAREPRGAGVRQAPGPA